MAFFLFVSPGILSRLCQKTYTRFQISNRNLPNRDLMPLWPIVTRIRGLSQKGGWLLLFSGIYILLLGLVVANLQSKLPVNSLLTK